MLVLNLPTFDNKKCTAYDRFHGNGPYGEIPTKKEPIRMLGFALPYNNVLLEWCKCHAGSARIALYVLFLICLILLFT